MSSMIWCNPESNAASSTDGPARHPELQVSTPAHRKHTGWYVDTGSRGSAPRWKIVLANGTGRCGIVSGSMNPDDSGAPGVSQTSGALPERGGGLGGAFGGGGVGGVSGTSPAKIRSKARSTFPPDSSSAFLHTFSLGKPISIKFCTLGSRAGSGSGSGTSSGSGSMSSSASATNVLTRSRSNSGRSRLLLMISVAASWSSPSTLTPPTSISCIPTANRAPAWAAAWHASPGTSTATVGVAAASSST